MKILHICNYIFGSSVHVNLFDAFNDRGVDIVVYAGVNKKEDLTSLDRNYLVKSHVYNKYDRLLFAYKNKKIFKDLLVKIELDSIDIVHAHTVFTDGYVAYKINKLFNIPYVVSVRNTDVNVFFRIYKKRGFDILKNASKIVCISSAFEKKLLQILGYKKFEKLKDKIICIPNGIDGFWLSKTFMNKDRSDTIRLLTCANFNKNKNLKTLIKVVNNLNSLHIKTKIVVCGKIEDRKLEKYIINNKNVDIVGVVNKFELYNYFACSDIFILLSKNETFGLVYAEAMAASTPIIYTENQGFDGQFSEGYVGFHSNYLDISSTSENVIKIYSEIEKFSKNAYEGAKKYDWKKISKNYESIYIKIKK